MKTKSIIQLFLLILLFYATNSRTIATSDALQDPPHPDHLIFLQYGEVDTRLGEPALPSALSLKTYPPGVMGYYLVQFIGIILPEWKDALEATGARVIGYVPNNTFLVHMTTPQHEAVAALAVVQWTGIFQPAYRVAPWLATQGEHDVQTLTVLTFSDSDLRSIVTQLQAWGGEILATSQNVFAGKVRVAIDVSLVPQIAGINGIMWIEPWTEPQLANDIARDIMDVEDTVWNTRGLYGAGQIVAIADTGLDVGDNDTSMSDDFEGRIVNAYCRGRSDPCDWGDPHGHGTHVAGSATGNGRNSGSDPAAHSYMNSYAGVAPEAGLVFQSTLAADGHLRGLPLNLNELFQQAYDDGARIHSNSWGTSGYSGQYNDNSFDVDQFIWTHPDMVILFAAGNEGEDRDGNGVVDLNSVTPPGTAKNAITVGATENLRPSDGLNCTWDCFRREDNSMRFSADPIRTDHVSNNSRGMAAFSGRGLVAGNRIKPDVVAPGTNILSARTHQHTLDMDVEGSTAGWTLEGSWVTTDQLAHSGTHSWTTNAYANNQNISLTSPMLDIHTGADAIAFWTRFQFGAGDTGFVEYSINGVEWRLCQRVEGTQTNWVFGFCLPETSHQSLQIRFRLHSDGTGTGAGWFIDDIQVTPYGWGFLDESAPNAHYLYMGGTSMATPLVAGAATLVREYYVDQGHTPSAALIKATLINGAEDIAPGQYGTGSTQEITNTYPNNTIGWGRVNLQTALFPTAPQTLAYKDVANPNGLNVNQRHVYRYEVRDVSTPFRVTLVWTDFPALPPTGTPQINHDLDLTVRMPNGSTRHPNSRVEPDRQNNVEDIFILPNELSTGVYVITVIGHNIADNGPQGYALAVRGGNLRETLNLAVTPSHYDNIGAVLGQLGYTWTPILDSHLTQYDRIWSYGTIFANCSSTAISTGPSTTSSLQGYVRDGGSIYASDWAYSYIKAAFPTWVSFRNEPRIGNTQYVDARVVDPGLANYLNPSNPPSTIKLRYNLENWAVIEDIASNARVHLRGNINTSAGIMSNKPLTVSFNPFNTSTGRVVFTTFHNEAQQTDVEKKLLQYLALIPSTSAMTTQAEQLVKANGFYARQTNINTINQGETSPGNSYPIVSRRRLMFVINWSGSMLRLSVFRPDGVLYRRVDSSSPPISVLIQDAEPGAWRYTVEAVTVPYQNYPYAVVIGDQFPEGVNGFAFLGSIVENRESWVEANGLAGKTAYDFASTNPVCSTLFASTDSGAYRSYDGGKSWAPIFANAAAADTPTLAFDDILHPSASLTPAIAECPSNAAIIYLTTWGGGVYRSTDAGNTWQPRNGGALNPYLYDLIIDPGRCDVVYAASAEAGVFKTTDGGGYWQAINNGLGDRNTRSLALAPGNPNQVWVGTTTGVFRSTNGGATWQGGNGLPPDKVWAVVPSSDNANIIYAGLDSKGVFRSLDGGASWQPQHNGLGEAKVRSLVIDPLNPQVLYAGRDDSGGVYRSLDGGANWSAFNDGLTSRNVKSLWLDGGNCHTLLAGTTNGAWYFGP